MYTRKMIESFKNSTSPHRRLRKFLHAVTPNEGGARAGARLESAARSDSVGFRTLLRTEVRAPITGAVHVRPGYRRKNSKEE